MSEVSIIIPVYNKENYIEASLRSVLEQPFRDVEVIVINDGSTDGSLNIAERIAAADSRVRIIDIPNGGVSNARNVGMTQARGEWIQFLDADDLLERDYLIQAMQVLKEHPADVLFSGFTMVNEHGVFLREIAVPDEGMRDQTQLCDRFIRTQYATGFFGYISNKLFRRSLVEKSGAHFPIGTTLAEDLDFYVTLYPSVEKAYFWNGRSFRYLQTETNYLYNPVIDYYSQIQIHLDIKAWFEKSGLYMMHRDILNGKVSQYAYYILFYDNEAHKELSSAFHFLCERADIMECITPNCMKGFARMILHCLRHRSLLGIKALFTGRNCVRSFFRAVKRHD